MNVNENEAADGVSECDDDSINKGIDTEERVVPENETELLVFKKKDIRSKGAYNNSPLLASSLSLISVIQHTTTFLLVLVPSPSYYYITHFLYHIFHMKTLSVFRSLSLLRRLCTQ